MKFPVTGPPPPPGPAVQTVANSNWRVVAVNGRATPVRGEFYVRFGTNTFGAKFGCNGMGADYVQRGNIIDAGPVIGDRETDVLAVIDHPLHDIRPQRESRSVPSGALHSPRKESMMAKLTDKRVAKLAPNPWKSIRVASDAR